MSSFPSIVTQQWCLIPTLIPPSVHVLNVLSFPGCNFLFDVMPRKYSQKTHSRQHGKAQRASPSPSRASPSPSRTASSIPPLPSSDTPLLCPTCHSHLPVSTGHEAGYGDKALEKLRWMNGANGASAAATATLALMGGDGGHGSESDGLKGAKED